MAARSLESLRAIQVPFNPGGLWLQHVREVPLDQFRAQGHYLHQRPEPEEYAKFFHELQARDDWRVFDVLDEDDAFGAITFNVDGRCVSRDLLDSVSEIFYLKERLGWSRDQPVHLIDVGAGYGRLAHRLCTAMPTAEVWCLDVIPESTWLCQQYLAYRDCQRGHVVPLDTLPWALDGIGFDVATAIHCWSETSTDAVAWWTQLLARYHVPAILSIGLLTTWGSSQLIESVVAAYGYELCDSRYGDIDKCHVQLFQRL